MKGRRCFHLQSHIVILSFFIAVLEKRTLTCRKMWFLSFCWKINSDVWIDGDTMPGLAQSAHGTRAEMFYSFMVRAVEASHKEFAKENLHTLSQEESQRSYLPRMDRSDLCISSLKDIILITLPDFAFPILKVTQSPEFNSPIKRCKQSLKQFWGEKKKKTTTLHIWLLDQLKLKLLFSSFDSGNIIIFIAAVTEKTFTESNIDLKKISHASSGE